MSRRDGSLSRDVKTRIDAELYEQIVREATRLDTSESRVVRLALRDYFAKLDRRRAAA